MKGCFIICENIELDPTQPSSFINPLYKPSCGCSLSVHRRLLSTGYCSQGDCSLKHRAWSLTMRWFLKSLEGMFNKLTWCGSQKAAHKVGMLRYWGFLKGLGLALGDLKGVVSLSGDVRQAHGWWFTGGCSQNGVVQFPSRKVVVHRRLLTEGGGSAVGWLHWRGVPRRGVVHWEFT